MRYLAFAAVAVALSACTQVAQGPATLGGRHPWTKPGDLRIAIHTDVKNLNPLLSSDTTDTFVDRFMFEPLLSADPKGNPVPMLATQVPSLENGGISRDGLTITYHLRPNAKWTDGVPVTSKDVKFSWQTIVNPNTNVVSRHGYDYIKTIDTPDDHTVVVHLKTRFSPFVNTFFAESDAPLQIVPEHVLASYPNVNQIAFNSTPAVSDGPFKFVSWSRGDEIVLTRNDGFFMGRPKLDKVEIKVVPDENTSVNLLKTHDIDWIYQPSITVYNAVKGIPGTKLVWVDVNGYEYIQLNDQHPPLDDVRVRQAVAYAINKQALIDTLTFGRERIATEDLPYWMWAHNPNVKPLEQDIPKAKQLLAQAGWLPGPDGIAQKNGAKLSLVLVTNPSNITRRNAAVQIQSMLRQAGIDATVKSYPSDVLFAPAGEGGILQLGNFDLSLAGWYAGIDPDDSSQFMKQNWPPGGYNYSRYYSPEMEAAQTLALSSYDRPTRQKAYYRIQQLLERDAPNIFEWYTSQFHPINDDFKGFAPNPVSEGWNAWQWSI
ncbi:MAG: ABC transporter substrate-binding protein [Vulcanimicrobiaceae bacterium]